MSWNEQVDTLTGIWAETQKKLWESWYDLIRTAPAPLTTYTSLLDEWRKLATQGVEMWITDAEPISKNVSRQLLASQSTMMRFLELTSDAWKAMLPKVETGDDWQAVLKSYVERLRNQLIPDAAGLLRSSQDLGELWKLYLEELQALTQPWLTSLRRSPWHLGEALTGTGGNSELVQLTNLYWDAYERTFGRLVESPGFGFTREINEKVLKAFDAWTDFRRASTEYQIVLASAWGDIFEQVMRELVKRSEQDTPIRNVRDLMRLWTETADASLEKVFRSEHYVNVQGRLFDAAMNYRLHEQEVIELVLKTGYIPTRSEVDEAHRNIYELRKEVKALKKALKGTVLADGSGTSIADLRQEINGLKKDLQKVQEASGNGKAHAPAE